MATTASSAPNDGATLSSDGSASPESAGGRPRRLERRRSLPGGRAVVGGFLVAAAAVGVFAVYLDATSEPEHSWVVATADLTAGERFTADDLGLVALDLPPELGRRAFTDPDQVVGAVATARITEYDIVLATHLADGSVGDSDQMSFAIDRARAVAGALKPGDRIDVVASYRGDEGTEMVARDILVLDVLTADGGLGSSGDLVLTVALEADDDALALTHAVSQADLQLVRVTARDATVVDR